MPDSQMVDRMSDPILTKLLEAESNLAAQEAELLAQIEAIRQKRSSLSAVIGMFSSTEGHTNAPTTAPTSTKNNRKTSKSKTQSTEPAVSKAATEAKTDTTPVASDSPVETNGASPTTTEPQAPKGRGRKKRATQEKPSAQPKQSTKGSRKGDNWRSYVRPEFGKTPLPKVVTNVLQREANGIFDVPTIVSTIFVQDTPKEVRNKARDRVLHILSAGVKEQRWYRGKTGQYSLSQSAAESTTNS